jgi:hypothetical protein
MSSGDMPSRLFHQPVGLADHLHVGVLDAVVDHLDEVAGAAAADPVAAGRAVVGLGGDGLQDGLGQRPGLGISARHDGGSVQGPFLAAADAGADEEDAGSFKLLQPADGVGEEGVAAVDQEIAWRELGPQAGDHGIHGLAGRDHDEDLPGRL